MKPALRRITIGLGAATSIILVTGAVNMTSADAAPPTYTSTSGAGDFGADTCLVGFVWRDARSGDHTCVTPATRDQAGADNGQAVARREPNGGPFGPDTCKQGYVWREAFTGDHVCVVPAVRAQAAEDNAQADARRASLNLWTTRWNHPANVQCNDGVCSTDNNDYSAIKINGDHFNSGTVSLLIRADTGRIVWSGTAQASPHGGFAGGSFGYRTLQPTCSGAPNGYARAYDSTSQRWSAKVPLRVTCATL